MKSSVGFLGIGNMGLAIIKGMNEARITDKITAYDIDNAKRELAGEYAFTFASTASEVVENCKYVVLAVKPQHLAGLLKEIKNSVTAETVFISICAGIDIDFIRTRTNERAKVILVMPNTPMMLGLGASAMATDEGTNEDELGYARSIIGSCGITEIIPLDKMKEIIPINGSSPAFIYLFAKGFIEYAAEQGIGEYTAQKLFSHTLTGAAKMITSSGFSIDELIQQVSSKGGTTVAGLEEFYKADLVNIVKKACNSCTARAIELGQENR